MDEGVEQDRLQILDRLASASARGDWVAAVAEARKADEIVRRSSDGEGWFATPQGLEPLAGAAATAVEKGHLKVACEFLVLDSDLAAFRDAIEALVAGDAELGFVHLERNFPTDPEACRLARAIGSQVAGVLTKGAWDRRLLAVSAIGMGKALDELEDEARRHKREETWARDHGLPGGVVDSEVLAAARVRLGLRRAAGDHAQLFENLVARDGRELVECAPALFAPAVLAARRQVEAGSRDVAYLETYALGGVLEGQEANVRRVIGAVVEKVRSRTISARRGERLARSLEDWVARGRALAAARANPEAIAVLDGMSGVSRHPVGQFQLGSDCLILADPCYGMERTFTKGLRLTGFLHSAEPGTWQVEVVQTTLPEIPQRMVALLVATHVDHPYSLEDQRWHETDEQIAVDSGMAGIFDAAHFHDEESVANEVVPPFNRESRWFDLCFARTQNPELGGVIPFGCLSSTGLGDGFYGCLVARSSAGIVGVCLDFGLLGPE